MLREAFSSFIQYLIYGNNWYLCVSETKTSQYKQLIHKQITTWVKIILFLSLALP